MFKQPIDLVEWIEKVWPIISNRTINKVEASLSNCEAQMYWAGTIIRIDLKPIKSTFIEWLIRNFLSNYHLTRIYKKRVPKGGKEE